MKKFIPLLMCFVFIYGTCSKKDDMAVAPVSANGYWKGSTNTYGVGLIVRSNGTARELINTSSLTLDDTSSSSVAKFEGTYTVIVDSIFLNSSFAQNGTALSFKGKMNTSRNNMTGSSKLTSGGLIINQIFKMDK